MEMDHMVTVTMLPDALALAGIGCVWLKATTSIGLEYTKLTKPALPC